jgi:predicted flavoprotein YhiN
MRKLGVLLLLPTMLTLAYAGAGAQTGTDRSVVASGGVSAANAAFQIAGTLGQPIIGSAITLHRTAWQGFWYTESRTSAVATVSGNSAALLTCSPNPISQSATIAVNVPEKGNVILTLHDLLGRTVMTLQNTLRDAGEFSVELNTEELPEGRYTVRCTHALGENTLPVLVVK